MGRDAFDLERFPGRRRSASSPDNLNLLSGGSEKAPIVPKLGEAELEGPVFGVQLAGRAHAVSSGLPVLGQS